MFVHISNKIYYMSVADKTAVRDMLEPLNTRYNRNIQYFNHNNNIMYAFCCCSSCWWHRSPFYFFTLTEATATRKVANSDSATDSVETISTPSSTDSSKNNDNGNVSS